MKEIYPLRKRFKSLLPSYAIPALLLNLSFNFVGYIGLQSLKGYFTFHDLSLPLDREFPFVPDWERSVRVGDQMGLSNGCTGQLIPIDSRFGKLVLYKNGLCAEKDRKMVCVANHDHDVSGLSFGRFSQTACSNGYFRRNCFF